MTLSNDKKEIISIILKLSDNHYLSDSKYFYSYKDKKLFWKSILKIKKFIENCIKIPSNFLTNEEEIRGCKKILEYIEILIKKIGEGKDSSEYSCSVESRNLSEESSKVLEIFSSTMKDDLGFKRFIEEKKNSYRVEKGGVDWPCRRLYVIDVLLCLADKGYQEREWLGDGCFDNDITYFGSDALEDLNFYNLSFEKHCEWYKDVIYKSEEEIKLIFKVAQILDKLRKYVYNFYNKDASEDYDSLYWDAPLLQKLRKASQTALNEILKNDKDNEDVMRYFFIREEQDKKEHELYKSAQKNLVRYTKDDLEERLSKLILLYEKAIDILKIRRDDCNSLRIKIMRFFHWAKIRDDEYLHDITENIRSLEQAVGRLRIKGIEYIRYILGRAPKGKRKKEGLFKEGLLYHYQHEYKEDTEILSAISDIDDFIVNM